MPLRVLRRGRPAHCLFLAKRRSPAEMPTQTKCTSLTRCRTTGRNGKSRNASTLLALSGLRSWQILYSIARCPCSSSARKVNGWDSCASIMPLNVEHLVEVERLYEENCSVYADTLTVRLNGTLTGGCDASQSPHIRGVTVERELEVRTDWSGRVYKPTQRNKHSSWTYPAEGGYFRARELVDHYSVPSAACTAASSPYLPDSPCRQYAVRLAFDTERVASWWAMAWSDQPAQVNS